MTKLRVVSYGSTRALMKDSCKDKHQDLVIFLARTTSMNDTES
jgi:hypothetical protein